MVLGLEKVHGQGLRFDDSNFRRNNINSPDNIVHLNFKLTQQEGCRIYIHYLFLTD